MIGFIKIQSGIHPGQEDFSFNENGSSNNREQRFIGKDGKRYVILFEGQIYNRKELCNSYGLLPEKRSEAELVFHLYEKLGHDFLNIINGAYVGAIYVAHKNEVILFRDRLGIIPFYYSIQSAHLILSSHLPSILSSLDNKKISDQAVANFLHLGFISEPYTIYQDVLKFPAGSYGRFKNGKLEIKSYWKPSDFIAAEVESNEKRVLGRVEELLRDAVALRMDGEQQTGCFLSGGTDSGIIAAIASDVLKNPIPAFNLSFEDAPFDETSYAEKMAAIIGMPFHSRVLKKEDVIGDLETGMKLVGEPFGDSGIFSMMAASKFAREHVPIALSGDGGDELFLGYGAYTWADRLSKTGIYRSRKLIATLLRMRGGYRNKRAARVFDFRSTDSLFAHILSQEQNFFSAREVEELMGLSPKKYIFPNGLARKLSPAEKQAFYDLYHYLKDDLLVKVHAGARYGNLDVRTPFLDHRLVEYAINIDPQLKRKNNEGKYILKKLMERYYPHELIYRKKWGFSIPMERWMKEEKLVFIDSKVNLKLHRDYDKLYTAFMSSTDEGYLYNRLYALQCLFGFNRGAAL